MAHHIWRNRKQKKLVSQVSISSAQWKIDIIHSKNLNGVMICVVECLCCLSIHQSFVGSAPILSFRIWIKEPATTYSFFYLSIIICIVLKCNITNSIQNRRSYVKIDIFKCNKKIIRFNQYQIITDCVKQRPSFNCRKRSREDIFVADMLDHSFNPILEIKTNFDKQFLIERLDSRSAQFCYCN